MFFRGIPKGEFRMGSRGNDASEEPVHRVVIPDDFYLSSVPVTQVQYRAMAEQCRMELASIEGNTGPDPAFSKVSFALSSRGVVGKSGFASDGCD